MLQRFENFILKHGLFGREDKLLLAFSGGADSVCLFHLLRKAGYDFNVAHCNFNLRGEESLADEYFVKDLAQQFNVPFFTTSFDTKNMAFDMKKGIQELARELRYKWFAKIMSEHGLQKLLTAHHQTDNLETTIINILRKTGIKGLHGIPLNEEQIARPLLFTNRNEIEGYMEEEHYVFREDSSNASDYYLRNQIRHFVVPELRKIQPEVEQCFFETTQKVKGFEDMAFELMKNHWQSMTSINKGSIHINIDQLNSLSNQIPFLFYNVQGYGFNYNQVKDIMKSSQIGNIVQSPEYIIIRERESLLLKKIEEGVQKLKIEIEEKNQILKIENQSIEIHILKYNSEINFKQENTLFLNADNLQFPLALRNWEEGDKIRPFGMRGHKKISDILTDKKVLNFHRNHYLVLEQCENELIALIPLTISENFRIQPNTTKILSIKLNMA